MAPQCEGVKNLPRKMGSSPSPCASVYWPRCVRDSSPGQASSMQTQRHRSFGKKTLAAVLCGIIAALATYTSAENLQGEENNALGMSIIRLLASKRNW